MYLPEDCPTAFSLFVEWMYRSALPAPQTAQYDNVKALFELYIFAEKLCMSDLKNKTMDQIQDYSKKFDLQIDSATCLRAYENTPDESPLRIYSLWSMLYKTYSEHKRERPQSLQVLSLENLDEIYPIITASQDFFRDFFLKFQRCKADIHKFKKRLPGDPRAPPAAMKEAYRCYFHDHAHGEMCYSSQATIHTLD